MSDVSPANAKHQFVEDGKESAHRPDTVQAISSPEPLHDLFAIVGGDTMGLTCGHAFGFYLV